MVTHVAAVGEIGCGKLLTSHVYRTVGHKKLSWSRRTTQRCVTLWEFIVGWQLPRTVYTVSKNVTTSASWNFHVHWPILIFYVHTVKYSLQNTIYQLTFFMSPHRRKKLIFVHRCVRIRLQRWTNRDKSGTPSRKRDKWASLENCDFFLGHVVENQDCPGKSWTGSGMVTLRELWPIALTFEYDPGSV